jgi:hypothetical protein
MKFTWSKEGEIAVLEAEPDNCPPQPRTFCEFRTHIVNMVKSNNVFILFDCSKADFPEKSAVEDLLLCNRTVKQKGGALLLLGPQGKFWERMQSEGATNLVPYRWDRQEALDDFNRALFTDTPQEALLRGTVNAYRPSLLVRVARVADLRDGKNYDPESEEDNQRISSIEDVPLHDPPPPGAARAELPPGLDSKEDWHLALEVFHTASALARKHKFEFGPETTFEEFLGAMTEKVN